MEENSEQFFGWTAWGANLKGGILYLDHALVNSTESGVLIERDVIARHMNNVLAPVLTPNAGSSQKGNILSIWWYLRLLVFTLYLFYYNDY